MFVTIYILLFIFYIYFYSGIARYNYTHEILKNKESFFKGQYILKDRRISIICRSQPNHNCKQY